MPLSAGTRVGPYEILSALGAGGMGEVYRARDRKLDRDVAIKMLPETLAHDPERLARFEREAKTLAALNHPNIAHIHGLEESGSVRALVMELVEGEDLSQRIARGPIPVDEALRIAKQIAEALEAAHDKGIIHRDLKPANIALTKDGRVKVLDFGLAKAIGPTPSAIDSTHSPTMASPTPSGVGAIVGTAAYMSPEQAIGSPADKRADVWAFGCVLYEMLTGRRVFDRRTVIETFGAVQRSEPLWQALPVGLPANVTMALQRCLAKEPRQRIRDIGDVRLLLDETFETPVALARANSRAKLSAALAALGIGVAAAVAWALMRQTPPAATRTTRFAIVPTGPLALRGNIADRNVVISPDGTHLAYVGSGNSQLVVRSLDRLDSVSIPVGSVLRSPFFSPDGRWIGFFTGTELKKVPLTGGPPISVCRAIGAARGASWGPDDTIVFATTDPAIGLLSVPASGGEPKVLTTPDAGQGEMDHVLPTVLPNGHAVLFTVEARGSVNHFAIDALDLRTRQRKTLISGGTQVEYVTSGHLIYAASGTLRAVRFDIDRLQVTGDSMPIVDQVMTSTSGAGNFAVSRTGTLIYVPGSANAGSPRSLVWVDRQGHEEAIDAPVRAYVAARLSPDGTRLALEARDQEQDIWVWNLGRRTFTRLTFDPGLDQAPTWTPDGRRIVFASTRGGTLNLYSQPVDGTGGPEQLTSSRNPQYPTSISPDGSAVIFREGSTTATGLDLMVLTLDSTGKHEPRPLIAAPQRQENGEVSPDGHWLAYQSDESGQAQVYVRPFPDVTNGRWQVSINGGTQPLWARNGRELFYLDGDALLTAVPIQTSPTFSAGKPSKILNTPYVISVTYRSYDVSTDGRRFLMIKDMPMIDPRSTTPPGSMVVIVNWIAELQASLPAK